MKYLAHTRIIITPLGRIAWYRRVNWGFLSAVGFCLAVWTFIVWVAAKALPL